MIKRIDGYEDYGVTEDGQIFSFKRNIWIKPQKDKDGYYIVSLYKNKKGKSFRLHRLVFEAFVRKLEKGEDINHQDKNKTNNCLNNLQPITKREHGKLHNSGCNNPHYGKHFSEESKQKMRLAKLGKKQTQEHIQKRLNTIRERRLKNEKED